MDDHTDHFQDLCQILAAHDEAKAATVRKAASAARIAALPSLIPIKRAKTPAAPTPEETSAAIDGVLAKGMALFAEGKCTALDIAKLENRAETMRFEAFARAGRGGAR